MLLNNLRGNGYEIPHVYWFGAFVFFGVCGFDRQDNIKKLGIENGCANYDPIDGHFYRHKALPDLAEPMPVDLTPKRKP